MIDIINAHKSIGLYKYSMHPSSYFIVDGKIKSINYFFCYHESEGPITIKGHLSHIYSERQEKMKQYTDQLGINWAEKTPLNILQTLCWESFKTNYPSSFIDSVKCIK
jgi:hypothetical protein